MQADLFFTFTLAIFFLNNISYPAGLYCRVGRVTPSIGGIVGLEDNAAYLHPPAVSRQRQRRITHVCVASATTDSQMTPSWPPPRSPVLPREQCGTSLPRHPSGFTSQPHF
ncbi:hypothetical protein F5883DRAFT_212168 [Diaporthe sp. PMI_573]|nr:hypothetical protein F5883DRAFT_211112 [Diaporthaceae sp. PMI_573]KAH8751124.1 hypothetical protein F5883DRAFT_212168 [Diaporthaceae sp. PMI_573]